MLTADLDKSNPQQSAQVIDPSSMVNAIISAHNSALATKDELLAAKDDTIAGLKRELSNKDELIISLRQQLLQLQQIQRQQSTLPPYFNPTGVADDKKI
jgi:predicted RNase H-like nuclease (RuvC/YqgF family)